MGEAITIGTIVALISVALTQVATWLRDWWRRKQRRREALQALELEIDMNLKLLEETTDVPLQREAFDNVLNHQADEIYANLIEANHRIGVYNAWVHITNAQATVPIVRDVHPMGSPTVIDLPNADFERLSRETRDCLTRLKDNVSRTA